MEVQDSGASKMNLLVQNACAALQGVCLSATPDSHPSTVSYQTCLVLLPLEAVSRTQDCSL